MAALDQIASAFNSPTFEKDGSFAVNKPVGSMSISPCGRDVVLASRQGLHIIDLDSPWAPPRHLPHRTPWEVADVQWSPFAIRDYWVVSTSNQKALVWNLALSSPRGSIEHVLHAHTRAITDVNFSAHHPDVLATCAVDSFVHCWDLRQARRPAVTFCDWFAGATQVKWNRQDPHVVASSHDRFLRIWDDRQGAYPLRSIDAHDTKIYGIDWNRTRPHAVVTCSLDKAIKFWDYSNEKDEPEHVIHTPFPVWRARHTPFGRGVLAMPQRGDNHLHLYDCRPTGDAGRNDPVVPVHTFQGHEDQVTEFLWRHRGTVEDGIDNREFQLVSWGADRYLRLHRMDPQTLSEVGYEKGNKVHAKLRLTRKDACYTTFRENHQPIESTQSKNNAPLEPSPSSVGKLPGAVSGAGNTMRSSFSSTPGGWVDGGFLDSRPGMRTKTSSRRDIDPISWMKGVKIGNREQDLDRSTVILSPSLKADRTWDTFDNIGEEIAHVGEKFKKVDFYEIDVNRRYIRMSMSGPWGQDGASVYLDCRLDFPASYPGEAAPLFGAEQTASVNEATIKKLEADVQAIAEVYTSHGRPCIEALLRYLQGEHGVEEATAWLKDERDASNMEPAEADEASSSDEEDDLGAFTGGNVDGPGLAGSGILNVSSNNANVPLPKACGAMWAKDGHLICFFPPKEEKSQFTHGYLGIDTSSLLSEGRKKLLDAFGSFRTLSSLGKSRAPSLATVETENAFTDSDSDEDAISPSSSSTSSRDFTFASRHLSPYYAYHAEIFDRPRTARLSDEAQQSNASTKLVFAKAPSPKSIISIHSLQTLLPSKRELAARYACSGARIGQHNSEIARGEGFEELADTWALIDMILRPNVRSERKPLSRQDSALTTALNDTRTILKRADSGVDLTPNTDKSNVFRDAQGPAKWHDHPVGRIQMIKNVFDRYENLADRQMLATMSCAFEHLIRSTETVHRDAPRQHPPRSTVASNLSAESRKVMLFEPYRASASPLSSSAATTMIPITKEVTVDAPSLSSSFGVEDGDGPTYFPKVVPSPENPIPGGRGLIRSGSTSHAGSSSPERYRYFQRSGSNLASALAASVARPFSFGASVSPSPPTLLSRKPYGSCPTNRPVGAELDTYALKDSRTPDEPPEADYMSVKYIGNKQPSKQPRAARQSAFSVRLRQPEHRQSSEDLFPLIKEFQAQRYAAYRHDYAHLLDIWQLPLARAEVLKPDGNMDRTLTAPEQASTDEQTKTFLSIGKRAQAEAPAASPPDILGLGIVCGCCHQPQIIHAGSNMARCGSCGSKRSPMLCAFCFRLILGRASPCLHCGHVVHASCVAALARTQDGDGKCVAGCDCHCTHHVVVEVQRPPSPLRQKPSELSAPGRFSEAAAEGTWRDGYGVWDDVAYESLAKNLGGMDAKGRWTSREMGRGSTRTSVTEGGGTRSRRSGSLMDWG